MALPPVLILVFPSEHKPDFLFWFICLIETFSFISNSLEVTALEGGHTVQKVSSHVI